MLFPKNPFWACTTCGACVEQCPSRIEIVNTIQQMRRSLALEEGQFAEGVAKTLQNIQSVGNPWGLDPDTRWAWLEGLDVAFAEPGRSLRHPLLGRLLCCLRQTQSEDCEGNDQDPQAFRLVLCRDAGRNVQRRVCPQSR